MEKWKIGTYSFDILLKIEVHDNSVQSKDTNQLKQAEQLKLFSIFFIHEYLSMVIIVRI